MNATQRNSRICDALAEYYHVIDKIAYLKNVAAKLKENVLFLARNGKYGKYSVGQVEKKEIKVRAYVRHSYRYIRRGKKV